MEGFWLQLAPINDLIYLAAFWPKLVLWTCYGFTCSQLVSCRKIVGLMDICLAQY